MTTKIFKIDYRDIRDNLFESLTYKAQVVNNAISESIKENLMEAYTDNPMADTDKIPYYSKEDVKKILRTVETPNEDHDGYETNYSNPVHKSKEGEEKLKNADTNKDDVSEFGTTLPTTDAPYDKPRAMKLMRDLYFAESEEAKVFSIDDDTEENFKAKLESVNDKSVELEFQDNTTLDLDTSTINKLLESKELRESLLKNFDSVKSAAKALNLKLSESNQSIEESIYDKDILVNEGLLKESINAHLTSKSLEQIYSIYESMFSESPKDAIAILEMLEEKRDLNKIERGHGMLVNRIRGGKLQMHKLVSASKGYKVLGDEILRMKPAEVKKRRIGAKFASKKRRNQQTSINRKTAISLRYRARRLEDKG